MLENPLLALVAISWTISVSEFSNDLWIFICAAFVLMENLKTEVKETSLVPDTVKSTAFLDACNILKCSNVVSATIEELSKTVGADIQPMLTRYLCQTLIFSEWTKYMITVWLSVQIIFHG